MRNVQDFLTHYRRQRRWTTDLVAAIPAERFNWAPAADEFSCGDLVRHLIQSEIFWTRLIVKGAAGEAFDPFGLAGSTEERMEAFRQPNFESSHTDKYGSTPEECLAAWSMVQERTEQELARIDKDSLGTRMSHPLTLLEAPVWEMLLVMIEHEAHHRGQLSAYMKAMGIPQPPVLGS